MYFMDDTTEPGSFLLPTLRSAARRFGVERPTTLRKAELIEALEYTAWTPEAENIHTCIREFRPERDQPENSCALCFRPYDSHPGPVPGRMGWPAQWRWKFGEPRPEPEARGAGR